MCESIPLRNPQQDRIIGWHAHDYVQDARLLTRLNVARLVVVCAASGLVEVELNVAGLAEEIEAVKRVGYVPLSY